MQQEDAKNNHFFHSDRAISLKSEDELHRATFAESLADAVVGWEGNDSLVIALYGEWGSGKSSVKNLMLEALRTKQEKEPYIVEFNPWQWAEQDKLMSAFFDEIGVVLGNISENRKQEWKKQKRKKLLNKKGKQDSDKLPRIWKKYQAYLSLGEFLLEGFKKGCTTLFQFIALISGSSAFFIKFGWLKSVVTIVGVITGLLAMICIWSEKFLEKLSAAITAKKEADKKNIQQIKKELAEALRELEQPILIILDDVDRLSPDEMKLLVQLVKVNADFPKLVYLMLFQRDIVEKGLSRTLKLDGKQFLEKVVQVGFNIPSIAKSDLERIFLKGVNEVLNNSNIWELFDQHRWGNLYHAGIMCFFENLRDVKRFLSSLSFHVSVFKGPNSFEVNPVDLITLEVLRVFEPKIYNQLVGLKAGLVENMSDIYGKEFQKQNQTELEALIQSASKAKLAYVKEILKFLFPEADWPNGGGYSSGDDKTYRMELRVCHPDIFDRYFLLVIPEEDISNYEIKRIVALIGNHELFFRELNSYFEKGKLRRLLSGMENFSTALDTQYAVPFLTALFDIGDFLPKEYGNMDELSSVSCIWRIIHYYLLRIEYSGRHEIFSQALSASNGVFIPTEVLVSENQLLTKSPRIDHLFEKETMETLIKQCLERIREAASSGKLLRLPNLTLVIYYWKEWSANEEVHEWIESITDTKEGLLIFLICFLRRSTSQVGYDYVAKIHWWISLKEIEKFIQLDILINKISKFDLSDLSDENQKVIEAFEKAKLRRAEGKADDDFDD